MGPDVIGAPIPRMVARVRRWLDEGKAVKIFTARVSVDATEESMHEAIIAKRAIRDWCFKHIGQELPVTCKKDHGMVELWDDRAIQLIPNTGERADGKE